MSHDMTKPTKWVCAQRRLGSAWASTQSDQSLLCTKWVANDPRFLHTGSEDSEQTGQMPRLIWVFAGRTLTSLVLSCHGSNKLCCRFFKLEQIWASSCENGTYHTGEVIAQASPHIWHICAVSSESLLFAHIIYEPRIEKTCLQVRLKQDCSATEAS